MSIQGKSGHSVLTVIILCLAVGCALGSFWYWVAYTMAANDTAWLMRSGQIILQAGRLPENDVFSWTCSQKHWVLYQWLFEVALGLIFNASGARGLWVSGMLTTIVCGIIYFFLLPRQWCRLRLPIVFSFPFLALALSPTWFFIRPQLVSHLFIVLFINACERFRRTEDPRALWYLPLLTVIWANCHPLWIIGLLILGIYLMPYGLTFSTGKDRKGFPVPLLILMACYLAVLVNPYGIGLVLYEAYLNSAANFKMVNELRPLFVDPPVVMWPFLVYLAIAAVIMLRGMKAIPMPGRILSALGILSSLSMNKFAPVGALLVWPYLGMALSGMLTGSKDANSKSKKLYRNICSETRKADTYLNRRGGFPLLLAAVSLSAIFFAARVPTWTYALTVFTYNDVQTFKFLAMNGAPHKHIFNDEPTGSLMIYFDVLPVFCDGRVDFFGNEFCDKWVSCTAGEEGWQQYLDSLAVDEIVIRDSAGLYAQLKSSNKWLVCYDNHQRSVWVRNDEAGRRKASTWQLR